MKIHCIFATRFSEPGNVPELIEAWDDQCIEANPDGWIEAKATCINDADIDEWREVHIDIVDVALRNLFIPKTVSGIIEEDD